MHCLSSSYVLALMGLTSLTSAGSPWQDNHGGRPIYVQSGQSIQEAITSAPAHARIIVSPGTYAENLLIGPAQSGLTLIGLPGATVVPPAKFTPNICTALAGPDIDGIDTQAGICVAGSDVELADFVAEHRKVLSVGTHVADVTITGLTVSGFTGPNIALVGAANGMVTRNTLQNGDAYGCLSAGSLDSVITSNTVTSTDNNGIIGICTDNSSGARVSDNTIDSYFNALCVQTPGSVYSGNTVTNMCVGAYVDPGVEGATVQDNTIGPAGSKCAGPDNPVGIYGIIVAGSLGAHVSGNTIHGISAFGGTLAPMTAVAGIAVVDSPDPVAVASGNMVEGNVLKDNDLDLLLYSNGTGNVFSGNACASSVPEGLCGGG